MSTTIKPIATLITTFINYIGLSGFASITYEETIRVLNYCLEAHGRYETRKNYNTNYLYLAETAFDSGCIDASIASFLLSALISNVACPSPEASALGVREEVVESLTEYTEWKKSKLCLKDIDDWFQECTFYDGDIIAELFGDERYKGGYFYSYHNEEDPISYIFLDTYLYNLPFTKDILLEILSAIHEHQSGKKSSWDRPYETMIESLEDSLKYKTALYILDYEDLNAEVLEKIFEKYKEKIGDDIFFTFSRFLLYTSDTFDEEEELLDRVIHKRSYADCLKFSSKMIEWLRE